MTVEDVGAIRRMRYREKERTCIIIQNLPPIERESKIQRFHLLIPPRSKLLLLNLLLVLILDDLASKEREAS